MLHLVSRLIVCFPKIVEVGHSFNSENPPIPLGAPRAATLSQSLPNSIFAGPAKQVAPKLIGCLLVKRHADGELLWGVLVETEASCQSEPACHVWRRHSPSNEMLLVKLVVGHLVKDVNNISIRML
ncbi:MAG: hypothetical protein RLZZ124_693 [Cyanobacteriota bacterium]